MTELTKEKINLIEAATDRSGLNPVTTRIDGCGFSCRDWEEHFKLEDKGIPTLIDNLNKSFI